MNDNTNNNDATQATDAEEPTRAYFRIQIDAPIDEVWKALTQTNTILPFFFNGVCKTPGLAEGAPIRMRTKDGKYTSVVGDVLEFEPPYRYAHTFKFTAYDDPPCVVRYELKESNGGTEFTLINEGVPAGTTSEKYMTQGGKFITENLKALVETGRPTAGGRFALFMMGLLAPFTPKRCRSEHWPL